MSDSKETVDGHESCRSELAEVRRILKQVIEEAKLARQYNYYGDTGSKEAYLKAIHENGELP